MIKQTLKQFRKYYFLFLILILPFLILTGFVLLVSHKTGQPIVVFFQDIFYQTHAPLYVGFISNIGMMVWSFAIAVCFYAAYLLNASGKKELFYFFMSGALFGTLLLLDDFFMFHEIIYPRYLHIDSDVAYAIYALMGIAFLIKFREILLESDFIFFIMALGFFALSIFFDELRESILISDYYIIAEDGTKFVGIIYWMTYFMITGKKYILLNNKNL
ncbi:MAG: hypothetical protein HY964_03565 [Ignavibacteriales bacterium]|nr:hypothetical protein [Ignavibacteriales bacterium]